jgi:flagellin FlaB
MANEHKSEGHLEVNLRNLIQRTRDERGITGLETAIILIAFVVVATVFAFVVLTTGIFSAERGKETVFAGLQKARGTMEVRGGVVVNALTTTPEDAGPPVVPESLATGTIQWSVATTAGGEAIPLDDTTVISYRDADTIIDNVTYTPSEVVGDGDDLLEPSELFTITVEIADLVTGGALLNPNERFTFEIQTPVGAVIDLTRSLPAGLDTVMQLH